MAATADGSHRTFSSREQILRIMMRIWPCPAPFDEHTRIHEHMQAEARWWREIDLAYVLHSVCREFGFRLSIADLPREWGLDRRVLDEQWQREFGPRFTFGALAEFISRHANRVPECAFPVAAGSDNEA